MPRLPIYDGESSSPYPQRASRKPLLLLLAVPAVLGLAGFQLSSSDAFASFFKENDGDLILPLCPPQPSAIKPARELVLPDGYREESARRLTAAVKIATVSYDDNGLPTEDPRWAPFFEFQTWLVDTFPAVFTRSEVTLEKVNTLGLLTTIQGSEPDLKPLLLTSHYDVTPAPLETYGRWTHPPFSGFNDGEYIWGRGAGDDKTLLVGQYEALSLLLQDKDFVPRRTILLSHGFDEEEVFARQGAGELAKFLEARYGPDSILLAIDEGTSLTEDAWGAEMAIPSTSEKGYMDIIIKVGTPGGHSSVPPAHSGIGIAADIVHALEANPYPNTFDINDPVLGHIICGAEHAPSFPPKWKALLKKGSKGLAKLADLYAATGAPQHAQVSTTQAIDVIAGGSKINSLPEEVVVKMNHRIQFSSNISYTQQHLADTIKPVADHFKLKLAAFTGETPEELGECYVSIELLGLPLEPAPNAKLSGGVWDLFAGSIKEAFPTKSGKKNIVVSPFGLGGNTDTKVYHALSKNIYRFSGSGYGASSNAHTVDEKTSIDAHLDTIMSNFTFSKEAEALRKKLKNPSLYQESAFINGKHVRAASGKTFPVIDPGSGDTIGNCPDLTLGELKDAIDVTAKAFESWRHSTPTARSQVLQKWRQLCIENQDDLALLITMENGKPLHESMGEVAYANSFLDWFAGEAMRVYGDFIPSPSPVTRTVVIKQPVGPCAFITPWNFPIAMLAKKISPAIAVGCSCVLKPPPETPFSVVAYAALATQAGLPDGLINVVPTQAATKEFGVEMCTSDIIKKVIEAYFSALENSTDAPGQVSFTGSTAVGRHLQQLCASAKMIHKITLELGGNAPFIVFDDADLDLAIEGYLAGKFRANGENCCAPNRTLIQAGIHDRFVNALQAKISGFKIGPGSDPNSTHGPLIHQVQRDKCKAFVDDMVKKGGTVVVGGKIPSNLAKKGAFYDATIVTGVPKTADSWRGEIFGPVAAITKFETEKEALDMANDCEMGLACYFYTTNVARCWRLSEELSYGMCGINSGMVSSAEAPFGGKNNSGLGREGSKYGIEDFTEIKLLAWGGISSKPLY
ncbi:Gly-Xaa carboxypeptidase [Pseudohyphozyma bogoriensis]|nr:Gly-Xaa carboxypeptidase [Pseudohyphozyma bogoriensis]